MGLFDGMKDKLGFSDEAQWQDDSNSQYQGGEGADGVTEFTNPYNDASPNGGGAAYDNFSNYDDTAIESDDYPIDSTNPLSFEEYNPDSFQNVTFNTERKLKVASYDDITNASASRRSRSYSSSSRGYSSQHSDAYGSSSRSASQTYTQAQDPYSQFDSDIKQISSDPASRIEIVRPSTYADVEKIASSFKAGKTVVIVLSATSAELAKRVLDFSFGVASALNGTVDKEGAKTFIISKMSRNLSDDERAYLRTQGAIL